MRWGSGEHNFMRPVQNITVMLDGDVVPCEVWHCIKRYDIGAPSSLSSTIDVKSCERVCAAVMQRVM